VTDAEPSDGDLIPSECEVSKVHVEVPKPLGSAAPATTIMTALATATLVATLAALATAGAVPGLAPAPPPRLGERSIPGPPPGNGFSRDSIRTAAGSGLSGDSIRIEARAIRALLPAARSADAERLARTLLWRVEAQPTVDSLQVADALDVLVECLVAHSEPPPPAWFELAQRVVAIRERLQGPEHPALAVSLRNLGALDRDAQRYSAAITTYRRALAIQEKALGPDDVEVATTLGQLANVVHESGDLIGAKPLRDRSLAIREKVFGPEHPEVARSLVSRGNLFNDLGDYAASRRDLERAQMILEKDSTANLHVLAVCYNNLGNVLAETGELAQAQVLREKTLTLFERMSQGNGVAMAQVNLANLLVGMGDPESAKPLYERGIENFQASGGPLGHALTPLGTLLHEQGDLVASRRLLERAVRYWEETVGLQSPELAESLDDLADVFRDTGEDSAAGPLYRRALAISEQVIGPESVPVAQSLLGLANWLRDRRELAEAEPLYERALRIREKSFGPDHPEVAVVLRELATLLMAEGRADEAVDAALRAEEIRRRYVRLSARSLPERQALGVARIRSSGLDAALSLASRSSAEMARRIYDAVIRSRAVVLDEMAARHRAAWSAGDTVAMRLAISLASVRQRLANLSLVARPDDNERHRKILDATRAEEAQAERALAGRSGGFREEQRRGRMGLDDIAAALAPRSAVVSFVRYERPPLAPAMPGFGAARGRAALRRAPYYLAFVLRPGGSVTVVPLGAAGPIDALATSWAERAAAGPSGKFGDERLRRSGVALRQSVWEPIAAQLAGLDQAFLIPDGALHQISFAALPVGPASYVVEQRPVLHYLSTERDLVIAEPIRARNTCLLAFGGPSFDEVPDSDALIAGEAATMAAATPAAREVYRGAPPTCSDFLELRFPPLPGSIREIRDIGEIWEANTTSARAGRDTSVESEPDRRAVELIGRQASEAAFKRLAPLSGALHLATHGFLLSGRCEALSQSRRGVGVMAPAQSPSRSAPHAQDPLLLSGLALAGANRRDSVGVDQEDGILTAEEIAATDLSGVGWAVLSACQSGAGGVQSGEGVLGLRRAFEVAGAGTLIMSLWPVEDEAARAWMDALYRARFARGMTSAEAVRSASLSVLEARRARHESTHPFYWGGFVAAGDWR
jgi:CHAT domain-containing protein/tetratricopeptide (TPR) repeat protein